MSADGQAHSRGLWRRFSRFLNYPRLQIPPEPPLLTEDAVQAVLREVGLLLDYLNRLPESRLSRFFPGDQAGSGVAVDAVPPCKSYPYFLDRIASIAAQGEDARPGTITVPASFQPAPGAPQEQARTPEDGHLGDLAFLIWTRDFLASVAAPATLDTIRVTRAFRAHRAVRAKAEKSGTGNTEDERDLYMSRYGFLIARRFRWFTRFAFALLWCSLYVSYLVYTGQTLLQENAALQADYAAHESRVKEAAAQEEALIQAALRNEPPADEPLLARAYCDVRVAPADEIKLDIVRISTSPTGERTTALATGDGSRIKNLRMYVSERQRALCTEYQNLAQRRGELVRSHQRWWDHSVLLRRITQPDEILNPLHWFRSTSWSESEKWHLDTFRYGMQQIINGLLAGIMPAMYAALGALASLFRRLAQKIEREQLAPADYSGMLSSLVLGIMTGAVIGLFTNVLPQAGQTSGLPLSTTALALLAGYATDRVFGLFDSLAERVFSAPVSSPARTA